MADPLRADPKIVKACMKLYSAVELFKREHGGSVFDSVVLRWGAVDHLDDPGMLAALMERHRSSGHPCPFFHRSPTALFELSQNAREGLASTQSHCRSR